MEKSRKPKIRFKGFTDDWEQRELGELLTKYTDEVNVPHNGYERLGIRSHAKGTFHSYVSEGHELQTGKMHRVAADKFIVNITFGWEHAVAVTDKNDAGKLVSHRFPQYSLSENLYSKFFKYIILDDKFKHHLWLSSPGGAGRNRVLKLNEMLEYKIKIPNVQEQQKIAKVLMDLDNLITLHQRKLDTLINVKKSMLEKMFPKQGSKVPEIRFNGFTDDWEQREFSEMFDCTISNNTLSRSELSYDEGLILNVHYGDILIKYGAILDIHKCEIPRIPDKKKEDFRGSLLQPGDIVIADTAEDETTGKACEIGTLFENSIVAGLHTMVARPNIEMASGYLGYYLNSNAYHCQLLPMMQGIKVLSLSRANVKKTALKLPKSTKEQQLIANYFIQLDNLITLHQRKLEKLKNIKKSMLEKMFI